MMTVIGEVPGPEEGTELHAALLACEECRAEVCEGGPAMDPVDAASSYRDEPWCPGHCQRFWELAEEAIWGRGD